MRYVPLKVKMILNAQRFCAAAIRFNKSIDKLRPYLDNLSIGLTGSYEKLYSVYNKVLNFNSGDIPIRIYYPTGDVNLPITIYVHGGSWIGGSIDTHDKLCRRLCKTSNSIVISIGYRLAPEYPFPSALKDLWNVINWTYVNSKLINGNSSKISLVGDSAGGNLIAAICKFIIKKGGPKISSQVLIYPCTNLSDIKYAHWSKNKNKTFINNDENDRLISLYIKDRNQRKNPYVSPILAKEFTNLPPTLVITAEYDPLRKEGYEYFLNLKKAGVEANYIEVTNVPHGFMTLPTIFKESIEVNKKISDFLYKINDKKGVF